METALLHALSRSCWIFAPAEAASPLFTRKFTLTKRPCGILALTSFGFFTVFLNGKRVGEDYFRPSNSLFGPRDTENFLYPISDELTYRAYVSEYDVTEYLQPGENILQIWLGDGFYRQTERTAEGHVEFGDQLGMVYAMHLPEEGELLTPDGNEIGCHSPVTECPLFRGECQDTRIPFGEGALPFPVELRAAPKILLTPEDAPPDRIIRSLCPSLLLRERDTALYDAGENISGFVRLRSKAVRGTELCLQFAENLDDLRLDFRTTGSGHVGASGRHQIQEDRFICDGSDRIYAPNFVWHGFRYFTVSGEATVESVAVVHSDTPITAEFVCDSPELNWLISASLRSQLDNMHGGVPSDCPHRERLGYTGDGQICAPTAMLLLDSKRFYRKWIRDIFDSQCRRTGHVNHTAPFAGGGGGPGGWGCAAILVPWNYRQIFGDREPLDTYYDNMSHWISYLCSRIDRDLVVREEEDGWCLGDWCTVEPTMIPEPYVNTCYFVHCLEIMEQVADLTGHPGDIPRFSRQKEASRNALRKTYGDPETGSFCGGVQGADAYAIFAGIGNEQTENRLREHYREAVGFDTGFLGTDILCELLFSLGEADTVVKLMTSHTASFGTMMEHGATTIWENFGGGGSHNHPMFGACSRQLLTSILGIRQEADSVGYEKLLIAPQIPKSLQFASGSLQLPNGKISVSWKRQNAMLQFTVSLPPGQEGTFVCDSVIQRLSSGSQIITLYGGTL